MPTPRSGWQTIIADLALILFMVSAAALDHATSPPTRPIPAAPAVPVAVYRPAPSAPSLFDWLAMQAMDKRQRLVIVVRYGPHDLAIATSSVAELAGQANAAGVRPRVQLEPASGFSAEAQLIFDGGKLAR